MAHAIWHIDPSYIGRYWKDKLMGGALAAQEGVVDPLLDRLVGTAPGIPPRPFFGGESGVPPAQPTIPGTPVGATAVEGTAAGGAPTGAEGGIVKPIEAGVS